MVTTFLGYTADELENQGGIYTAKEIVRQPELWLKTYQYLRQNEKRLSEFLRRIFSHNDLFIILTGAGTSAFIGDVLEGQFQKHSRKITRAIPTTDLISHPDLYFLYERPTLLVSFARSGDSPESVQSVNVANHFCNKIYHLIITCNPNGALAQRAFEDNAFVFLLPGEADDQSLAMTGSFSSMLLAGLLIAQFDKMKEKENVIKAISKNGHKIIRQYNNALRAAAGVSFKRAVFLGSGSVRGIARESHLKLQELSDGKVVCKHDSYLGFRHGPKAVIDESTLMVYLRSNDNYVSKYETDLIREVQRGQHGIYSIAVMQRDEDFLDFDLKIITGAGSVKIPEEHWAVCAVVPAQILGFHKSLHLGLKPDRPSESGTITRVVQGVQIYEYDKQMAEIS